MRALYRVITVTDKNCHCVNRRCVQRFPLSCFPKGVQPGSIFMWVDGRFELFHGTLVNEDGSYTCRRYGEEPFFRRKPLSLDEITSLLEVAEKKPDSSLIPLFLQVFFDESTLTDYLIPSELMARLDRCLKTMMEKEGVPACPFTQCRLST